MDLWIFFPLVGISLRLEMVTQELKLEGKLVKLNQSCCL